MTNGSKLPDNALVIEPGELRPLFCPRKGLKTLFGIETQTWANWASQGIGPPYYRVGKLAIYNIKVAADYITRHPVKTSEAI